MYVTMIHVERDCYHGNGHLIDPTDLLWFDEVEWTRKYIVISVVN